METYDLNINWLLKQRNPSISLDNNFVSEPGWLPASVPGVVHLDLMAAGVIKDPFYGLNENEVQWIGERDWLYRRTFDLQDGMLDSPALDLVCDGLDTFATVWLNGVQLFASENMFVPVRVGVKSLMKPQGNDLHILFDSPVRRGVELEKKHGAFQLWNTTSNRVHVRKAQCHYGWDWGPVLITSGPWRPIRLEGYSARIVELHCPVEVTEDLQNAALPVTLHVETAPGTSSLTATISLIDPQGQPLAEASLPMSDGVATYTFQVERPQLWWTNGYGEQPLYQLSASILAGEKILDSAQKRLGLRRLSLVQDPVEGEPGKTFLFEVNNTPIFCGGVNWIPADSLLPRLTSERYRAWLNLAKTANMQMVRIWGGGIWEDDVFYDACDELGLLVWQDFMFACAIYPAYPEFLANVRAEAEFQVCRLRDHACLALWSGNNEDYAIARVLNVYDPAFNGDFTTTAFPAREIYERLLPQVCAELDPTHPYWPGSPWNGTTGSADEILGDNHIWTIWHGSMAPYQDYPKFKARFISEFGMQAAPDFPMVERFGPASERYPHSRSFEHHNKSPDGSRRLAAYLADNVYLPTDIDSYIYATQFIQAEALANGIRGWRRRWSGPGRYYTAGAIVWQLNDCWPVTSWAIADYDMHPKAAWYVVRRELASLTIGLAKGSECIELWVNNAQLKPVDAQIEVKLWSLDGQCRQTQTRQCSLPPNQACELPPLAGNLPTDAVAAARLLLNGEVVARAFLWPEPFKYLALPDPMITIQHLGEDHILLQSSKPAKGILLQAGADIEWSDNFIDLVPGDPQMIEARGLRQSLLHLHWLMTGKVGMINC